METTIKMSAEELTDYNKYKEEQERKQKAKELAEKKMQYENLVEETISTTIDELKEVSKNLATAKKKVYDDFNTIIEMKDEIFGLKEGQRTNTFSTKDGNVRITLGYNTIDAYTNTVEIGIAKTKEYLDSLIEDRKTRALINQINALMSKDAKGNLKPSKVALLSKLANELNSAELQEAVKFITDSYYPQKSKQFVRAQIKNEYNEWEDIPLGMTEAKTS